MRRLTVLGLLCALGACAAPQHSAQRYAVFFQGSSVHLDDGALATVTQAAAWAKDNPTAEVHVVGYADPEGSPESNLLLSRTRAQVVADELKTDGVEPDRIRIDGRGAVDFAYDSQEARRVTISLRTY